MILAISRFDLLSGASNAVVNALPVLIGVAFLGGAGYGVWLKVRRPNRYRQVTEQLGA